MVQASLELRRTYDDTYDAVGRNPNRRTDQTRLQSGARNLLRTSFQGNDKGRNLFEFPEGIGIGFEC